jgi:tetratricopeptide (TPR) repeat protein
MSYIVRGSAGAAWTRSVRALCEQDWPRLEVLLAGAPESVLIEFEDERVRFLPAAGTTQAECANAGMSAARGEYLCFLDAGDLCAPYHATRLIQGMRTHPQALLCYARGWMGTAFGAHLLGRAFHRAAFFHDEIFCFAAAVISRRAVEMGSRFDTGLALGADTDFARQLSLHGDCVFLQDAAPVCSVRPDAAWPNCTPAQRAYAASQQHAKWAGEREYHTHRSTLMCSRATELLRTGQVQPALQAFEMLLHEYPDDADALHGIALCALQRADLDRAHRNILRAMELNPADAGYRQSARSIARRTGGKSLPPAHAPWSHANALAAAEPLRAEARAVMHSATPRRASRCACGSGKRRKHCCDARGSVAINERSRRSGLSARQLTQHAQELLYAGRAEAAAETLDTLTLDAVSDPRLAQLCGDSYNRMYRVADALKWLAHAVNLSQGAQEAQAAYRRSCTLALRREYWRSAAHTVGALLQRLNARTATAHSRRVHVVSKMDTLGGSERRALNLCRELVPHSDVTLWSVAPPLAQHEVEFPIRHLSAGDYPKGGHLVLIGTYFPCGDWLEKEAFDNITLCHNLTEQYSSLIERLVQIERNPASPRVRLTFPSARFRHDAQLPGTVEYSPIDFDRLGRSAPLRLHCGALCIGRHARAHFSKFHPNEPSLFRELLQRGHRVRLMGGAAIAHAFAQDQAPLPELLDSGAETPRDFLDSLDVFLYRKHPVFYETGGSTVMEAMAAGLPVIVFAEDCGVAELIEHGRNGVLVDDELEALAWIERLAADPALRQRMGQAAHESMVALMRQHEAGLLEHYLGISQPAASLTRVAR